MKTRIFGRTKLNLSVIGLGTWGIGEEGRRNRNSPQNDRDSIDTVLKAIETGINWIDTAPSYGLGYAEEVVGRAISISKNKPLISTKCGLVQKNNKIYNSLEEKSIRFEIDASRKRLGVDVIDLYQIHKPLPEEDIEHAWDTIAELKKEGKIRYAGVSNFSIEQLKRLQAIRQVDFIQTHYSLLFRGAEEELLYCAENNIGAIAYRSMERGLLSERYKDAKFPGNNKDHYELIKRLDSVAFKKGMSVSQLAIAWILRRPEITSVIVGARFPSQIKEAAMSDVIFSSEDLKQIEELLSKK